MPVVYPRPGAASCGRLGALRGLALREVGTRAAFVIETDDGIGLALLSTSELACTPLNAWEPAGPAFLIEATGPADVTLADGDWIAARATARRCLAAEILGLDTRILELAVEHVRTREQFGHPLGSFQAVRHRLADMHVQVVAGRQLARDAWLARDTGEADQLAVAAKAYAARAHRIVGAHAMQVCGAVGLTWEHPLVALVRRGFFLESLLGDERGLAGDLGALVADAGSELPAVLPVELMLADAP
jgi:alkylation response protein AidB-like acyl-CoA dehydrogenase